MDEAPQQPSPTAGSIGLAVVAAWRSRRCSRPPTAAWGCRWGRCRSSPRRVDITSGRPRRSYSWLLSLLTTAKHGPTDAARIPNAILLRAQQRDGGLDRLAVEGRDGIRRGADRPVGREPHGRPVRRHGPAARADADVPGVGDAGIRCGVRPSSAQGWLVATILTGVATAACGIGGVLIVPAALVAGVGAIRGRACSATSPSATALRDLHGGS